MTVYFIRLLALIAVVVGIFAIIGSLLPRDYEFETSLEIDAAAAQVFPLVNEIENWQQWSQWSDQRVEGLQVQYSGPVGGVGATQTWTDQRGDGKLWIVATEPNERIDFKLLFAGFPEMASSFQFSETQAVEGNPKTRVTWSSRGTLPGGPFYGFFGPFFANGMQYEYDASLQRLKAQTEE